MKQTKLLRRSGAAIMAKLILLFGKLTYLMLLAVFNGSLGYLCAIGMTLCGAVGIAETLGGRCLRRHYFARYCCRIQNV